MNTIISVNGHACGMHVGNVEEGGWGSDFNQPKQIDPNTFPKWITSFHTTTKTSWRIYILDILKFTWKVEVKIEVKN